MRNIFALIFVTSGLVAVTYSLHVEDVLPDLHKCNCESYDEGCLIKAIESMRPYLATGVEKLGIPTFMPYVLKPGYKLFLSDRKSSLLLTNIDIIGLHYFHIYSLEVSGQLPNMEIVLNFPAIELFADAYRNVTSLLSPTDTEYYERIHHVFRNTIIYASVTGYKLISFASGNLPHFYLSNIYMTWEIPEIEKKINYFKLDEYTTALSTRSFNNDEQDLPHRRVRDEVLDDLSYFIRKDLKTMLDKLPLEMLCLP